MKVAFIFVVMLCSSVCVLLFFVVTSHFDLSQTMKSFEKHSSAKLQNILSEDSLVDNKNQLSGNKM